MNAFTTPERDDERDDGRDEVFGHADEPGGGGRRWWVVGVAGASVVALALVGAVWVRGRETPSEAAPAQLVALSSDGLPTSVSVQDVATSVPVARAALAGALPNPAGMPRTSPQGAIPAPVLASYRRAEATVRSSGCSLPWWVLAGVGKVESDHALQGRLDAQRYTVSPIRGPRLDGSIVNTRMVLDTDQGRLDGDPTYDRAMGPMQMLPGTWLTHMRDGDGDGTANPDGIDDATLTSAAFLCYGGEDFATPEGLAGAVLRTNNSETFLRDVLTWGQYYRAGVTPPTVAPSRTGSTPATAASVTPKPAVVIPPTWEPDRPIPTRPDTLPAPRPTVIRRPGTTPASPTAPAPRPSTVTSPRPTISSPRPTTSAPRPPVSATTRPTVSPSSPAPHPSTSASTPPPEPTRDPTTVRPSPADPSPSHSTSSRPTSADPVPEPSVLPPLPDPVPSPTA